MTDSRLLFTFIESNFLRIGFNSNQLKIESIKDALFLSSFDSQQGLIIGSQTVESYLKRHLNSLFTKWHFRADRN